MNGLFVHVVMKALYSLLWTVNVSLDFLAVEIVVGGGSEDGVMVETGA